MVSYPYLDHYSSTLTRSIRRLELELRRRRLEGKMEYTTYHTTYGNEVRYRFAVRAKIGTEFLYYARKARSHMDTLINARRELPFESERFKNPVFVGEKAPPWEVGPFIDVDRKGDWKPIPDPIDGVYLDPDTDGLSNHPGMPWLQMMDHGKWGVLEWYLKNKAVKRTMENRGGNWYERYISNGLDIGRMFTHYDLPKFEELWEYLPWNIFGLKDRIPGECINTTEKREWMAKAVIYYKDDGFGRKDQIGALQKIQILPETLHPGILALTKDKELTNFLDLLEALITCRPELLSGDLELYEIWDLLNIYPAYSGRTVKGSKRAIITE